MVKTPQEQQTVAHIAIVGISNAGKSTLLNQLVGAKLAIVTPKVQTTRTRVTGVVAEGDAQLIFVDTPGIFTPKKNLDRAMVRAAWGSMSGVDVVALVVDARKGINEGTQHILDGIIQRHADEKIRAVCIINKVDDVKDKRAVLLPMAEQLHALGVFETIFMVSALEGDGVGDIKKYFAGIAQPMPWIYPADQLTDMPMRLVAAEMTREQLLLQLNHEVPYDLTVETEKWEESHKYINTKNGRRRVKNTVIHQMILVTSESQKIIVVGKHGQRLKQVGEAARKAIGDFLGRPVHLFLFVKVKENWQDSPEHYQAMGLE